MSKEFDIFQRVFDSGDIVKDIPYEYKSLKCQIEYIKT